MEEVGFITEEKRRGALKTAIYLSRSRDLEEANNYFTDYIKKYLIEKYGAEAVYTGGLKVYTTLDRRAQMSAQKALQDGLRDIDKRRGFRGPIGHKEVAGRAEGGIMDIPPVIGDIVSGVVTEVREKEALVNASGIIARLGLEDAVWTSKVYGGKARSKFNLTMALRPGDVIRVKVKAVKRGQVELSLEQDPEVQGALVAVDPATGYIRALVGGFDYRRSEFNRALYASRQPGSSFKPVIYSLALEHGFTPASVIVDEESKYDNGAGGFWSPRNFDGEYHGPTRLRDALTFSRNVVTVKLVEQLGVGRVIEHAGSLGIRSAMPRNLTIALGSVSMTPLDLTMAYSVFANGGVRRKPVFIKYITDAKGRVLESNEPEGETVMEPQAAYLLTSMMKDVVNYGTGRAARALGRPAAGKTGTTNDYKDAWFLGYTTDLVAGVWVGFDDSKTLGHEETGGRAAAPVWTDFMAYVSDGDAEDFPAPEGIVTRMIDPETGLLANDWTHNPIAEQFEEGTEPREFAPSIWKADELHESPLF
jgi:penicillin-binding protein 1A